MRQPQHQQRAKVNESTTLFLILRLRASKSIHHEIRYVAHPSISDCANYSEATLNSTPVTNKVVIDTPTETSSDLSAPIWPIETGACKESSTSFLLDSLASLWADKSSLGKDQILKGNKFTEASTFTLPSSAISAHKGLISLDEQLPDKATATEWLNTFLRGPNMLFRICNETESWRLLDSIYMKEDIDDPSKCSIWLQLAAGCRFTTGTDEESYITLFESGHQYLEWCIEQSEEVDPVWVVPPMLLSCLYFMGSKPKTCWLTLGAAIRLAQVHSLDREKEYCPRFSEDEYERWSQVWRAMIFFDAWLSITLGKHPQISQKTTQDSFVNMSLEEFALPNASIEVNIAKLSVLICRFLVRLCQGKMSSKTQEVFFHALEEWASNLPQNLRYFPDMYDPEASQADEVGSLYLETFYFASVMTLTKPEVFASLSTKRQQISSHSRLFSQACVDASAQIGHSASRILERGFLFKRSWLVTTIVYHAGLVLALSLSVQKTSLRYNLNSPGSHHPKKKGLAAVTDVLSSCASHNPLARHNHEVLCYFRELIESYEGLENVSPSHSSGRELFGTPHTQATPPSFRESSMATTSPSSLWWQTSLDGLTSTSSRSDSHSSYGILAGPDQAISAQNELSGSAAANYHQGSVLDPTCLGWATPLPNNGSNYSYSNKLRSQPGSTNPGLEHYKPYMENFWSAEAFDFAQQAEAQGAVHSWELDSGG
ncbi:hypothetical protein AYO22_07693 [Fonsecaea multimorphosa]|nr:hypothetical protein AYO22_07693 [Fonsecaea multimorphosa]